MAAPAFAHRRYVDEMKRGDSGLNCPIHDKSTAVKVKLQSGPIIRKRIKQGQLSLFIAHFAVAFIVIRASCEMLLVRPAKNNETDYRV